jgi:arsenite methyltransferase
MSLPDAAENVVATVRDRYGKIAAGQLSGCCGVGPCGSESAEAAVALEVGYREGDLEALPEGANLGLGCGAPLAFLALAPGEQVVDLGSGAGVDAFLAARQVGETGRVIGVDMTEAMLARARASAQRHGFANVEFREGRLEALPVEDATIDAVTSNCVINLVPDKAVVFREIARILKPGGRLVISDIVLDGRLPERLEQDLLAWVGCVSGAILRADYFALARDAGLTQIDVLKDVDYLAAFASAAPEEAEAFLARAGVGPEEVVGKVRAITFRARRPQ